jgi:hypothetical protein
MKRSRLKLLKELISKEVPNRAEEPLSNIKREMGSVAHVIGNPMFKAEISVRVTKIYFDVGGVVILPAALPANERNKIPFYVWGLNDYHSSFPVIRTLVPITDPWTWIGTLIYTNFNAVFVNAGAVNGDLVSIYTNFATGDDCFVVVHCNNVAYGTLLNSFESELISISNFRYFVNAANINQFINPITFAYQTLFGKVSSDSVDPRMYVLPTEPQQNIADIATAFPIDKNLMTGSLMEFDCQTLNFIFFAEKVEHLTGKRFKT